MSGTTFAECHGCGKKKMLVHITAEDIRRSRPPLITMVCPECREKYRAAARLETRYSTNAALRDLALMVTIGFSLLLLFSNVVSGLRLPLPLGSSQVIFLVTAATSLTGLRMTYGALEDRYGFTHNLAWSLHSRYAMISISLILSGIFVTVFRAFFG